MCFLSAWTDHQPISSAWGGALLRSRPTNWQRNSCLDLCCCSPATSALQWWLHTAWASEDVLWCKVWKVLEPPGIHAYPPHKLFKVLGVLLFDHSFPPKLAAWGSDDMSTTGSLTKWRTRRKWESSRAPSSHCDVQLLKSRHFGGHQTRMTKALRPLRAFLMLSFPTFRTIQQVWSERDLKVASRKLISK